MKKKIIITGGSGFIGTNLVQFYIDLGWSVLSIDRREPQNPLHAKYFNKIDILDKEFFIRTAKEFSPDYLIHLAARTDLDETHDIAKYAANTQGVENVINACNACKKIKRIIFASSMLVCKFGYVPENEFDYAPNTVYGESKVLTEKIIHRSDILHEWLIVRPTSIWGPWFDVPYKNFFDAVLNKRYVHPGKRAGTSTYGFVGNTVFQMNQLLITGTENILHKTFYLGDSPPNNLSDWADEIAAISGSRNNLTAPYWIVKTAALLGDLLSMFNIKFPITSFRLKNMVISNILDLSTTEAIAPTPPYSRADGIKKTLCWMKQNT